MRSPEYKADPAIEKRLADINRQLAALRGQLADLCFRQNAVFVTFSDGHCV